MSKRVSVGKSNAAPKAAPKQKKEKVEEPEETSDVEQVEETKLVAKKPTRTTKKKDETPKVKETKKAVKQVEEHQETEEDEDEDEDNEVVKWGHDESQRVTSEQELSRQELVKTQVKHAEPETKQTKQQHENQHQHQNQQSRNQQYKSREYQPREHQNRQQDTFAKPRSTALSFSYNDYRTINHVTTTVSTPDLLRFLIVRAHDDGQTGLKRCLENTLRAVNLECKFPTLPTVSSPRPPRNQNVNKGPRQPSNLSKLQDVNEEDE
jgi:hypothetical protein